MFYKDKVHASPSLYFIRPLSTIKHFVFNFCAFDRHFTFDGINLIGPWSLTNLLSYFLLTVSLQICSLSKTGHNEHDYANLVFYKDEEHASPSHRFIRPFVCNKHFILSG